MKDRAFLGDDGAKQKSARSAWARMGVLIALLLAAGVFLWDATPTRDNAAVGSAVSPEGTAQRTPAPTYGRTAREAAYDKDVAALKALVGQTDADEAVRNQAAGQLAKMIAGHQIEMGVEEALQNAGFAPCMALMLNDALTVTVNASELTAGESATILSICVAHSDVAVENIRIMTGNAS